MDDEGAAASPEAAELLLVLTVSFTQLLLQLLQYIVWRVAGLCQVDSSKLQLYSAGSVTAFVRVSVGVHAI